jgi:hypothetical protein
MATDQQIKENVIEIVLAEWNRNVERIDELLHALSDSNLSQRTMNTCDRGLYILGHLSSRLDILLETLGISSQRFHELEEAFVAGCDERAINQFSATTLRDSWNVINKIVTAEIAQLSNNEWFEYPGDNKRISKTILPRIPRIGILLLVSHELAYYHGRLTRFA